MNWKECETINNLIILYSIYAYPSGRAVKGIDLRPLACWDCGFEPHGGHGRLSVVNIVR